MENFFIQTDTEVIENFKKQVLTKEDYFNIVNEHDPEFLLKINQSLRSTWDNEPVEILAVNNSTQHSLDEYEENEEDEENIDRYNFKLPFGYEEIELYDSCKCFDENFETGRDKKYILIEVNKKGDLEIKDPNSVLPSPQSKCVIDLLKVDEHSLLEFIPIDYDTFWGVRFKTFLKYKSDFLLCDERIMFEIMLVKYKAFDFKPFFWSKEVIFDEVGIKKDRASNIINRFISLGILTKKLVKTKIKNRPMQVNYYDLNIEKIMELIPKIYEERNDIDIENQIKKYLSPVLKK